MTTVRVSSVCLNPEIETLRADQLALDGLRKQLEAARIAQAAAARRFEALKRLGPGSVHGSMQAVAEVGKLERDVRELGAAINQRTTELQQKAQAAAIANQVQSEPRQELEDAVEQILASSAGAVVERLLERADRMDLEVGKNRSRWSWGQADLGTGFQRIGAEPAGAPDPEAARRLLGL